MVSKQLDRVKKFFFRNVIYFVMLIIIVVIAIISPNFLSLKVMRDILMQSSVRIIVAMGCMFIIIIGSADLSGGRMVGFAAVVSGTLAQQAGYYLKYWPGLPEMPIIVPILGAMVLGVCVGCLNGVIVSKLKVNAFLATLGMQMVLYGFNNLFMSRPPNNSQPLGGYLPAFGRLGTGDIVNIPYILIIALVCMLFAWVLQTKTNYGHQLFVVGGNREAARVSGINIFKVELVAFMLAGMFYGLAGSLESARTGSAGSNYGNAYELDAIASCIVGGCSAGGGIGSVVGVFAGVLIFNLINYGLTFIGVNSYWQFVFKGAIIIVAVAIDVKKYSNKD
ncbi:MAG: beta-methylgalactoside transporter [Treponema sp.]|jgi:methyl-galactoside transport system permease protein|nr:beta-methylgalactoside transporter [Treponema sp.]